MNKSNKEVIEKAKSVSSKDLAKVLLSKLGKEELCRKSYK